MKTLIIFAFVLSQSLLFANPASVQLPHVKVKITVSEEVRSSFVKGGRILLYVGTNSHKEPRNSSEFVMGINPKDWNSSQSFELDIASPSVMHTNIEADFLKTTKKVYCQVIYKQNVDDGQANIPGNIYSTVDSVSLVNGAHATLKLKTIIPPFEIVEHKFVKTVIIKSKLLSDFWKRPRELKASILLPASYYDNPGKSYPICYRVPGINGRYDGVNGRVKNKDFMDWWFAKETPQIIYVFVDSQGPYGDSYQVDSENNGPCGQALTEELIPEIEKQVHYKKDSGKRFLAGASTGGWVVLGLQIFYPDFFNGTWSYSPDPVDFEHYGLIDIYHDESAFYNRFGYLQPESRTIYDEPRGSMKEAIEDENVISRTNTYAISGNQFGSYNAVFGPRGKDGLPTLMIDPITGKIDHAIAKQWEKYDLKKVLQKNWSVLGPKLQGKIWIWSGDSDGLYSNVATRFLKIYLDKTENPKSDAKISFTAMAGHCAEWSDKAVLNMIAEKANKH